MSIHITRKIRNIEEIIARMRHATGTKNDTELSKILNIKPNSITSWKTQESVPYRYLDDISENTNFTFDWLLTGEGPMYKEPIAVSTKIQKIMEYEEQMPEETEHALDEAIRRLQTEKQVSDLQKQVEKLKAG